MSLYMQYLAIASQLSLYYIMIYYVGAFGLVHKGELKGSDEMMSPVAIKTIKCKH